MIKSLFYSGIIICSLSSFANTSNNIQLEARAQQVNNTNKIIVELDSRTSIDNILTFHSYTKIAYKLICPHSYQSEIYIHGRDINENGSGERNYLLIAGNLSDDESVKTGYPMAGEFAWLKKNNQVKSTCKVEYQGLAVFDSLAINLSLSDLLPLGANISLPSNHKRTAIKNHLVELRRPATGGGHDCIAHCTPLLIDLNRDGIHLGPAGVGVDFDLANSGQQNQYQWVQANGDEAFLVRDLNNNGIIDDGGELFGSGTMMVYDNGVYKTHQQTYAPNGFVALAQYDQIALGGNDDGIINNSDWIWHELQLWLDKNANGLTDTDEIIELEAIGLTELPTIPKISNKTDPAGNGHFFWAWAFGKTNHQQQRHKVVDIFFKVL